MSGTSTAREPASWRSHVVGLGREAPLLVPGLTLPMHWQNDHRVHHLDPRVPFHGHATCFVEIRTELEAKGNPIEGYARGRSLPRPFGSNRDAGVIDHSRPHVELIQ